MAAYDHNSRIIFLSKKTYIPLFRIYPVLPSSCICFYPFCSFFSDTETRSPAQSALEQQEDDRALAYPGECWLAGTSALLPERGPAQRTLQAENSGQTYYNSNETQRRNRLLA